MSGAEAITVNLPPTPEGLLDGLRNAGYTTGGAVSDLIDNAVAADARHVDVRVRGNVLEVADDGSGMNPDALAEALRISGAWGRQGRSKADVGRYGIGMKGAALHLSGSGRMEVESRAAGHGPWRGGWNLATAGRDGWKLTLQPGTLEARGTIVRAFDPILQDGTAAALSALERHLALAHSPLLKEGKVSLTVSGQAVPLIDILTSGLEEAETLFDREVAGIGRVQAAILPIWTMSDPGWLPERQVLGGLHLWLGNRAITWGGWHGLHGKGNPPKGLERARIVIRAGAHEGERWGVDISKQRCRIPEGAEHALKKLIREVTEREQLLRQRSERSDRGTKRRAREGPVLRGGQIDRQHQLVKAALEIGNRSAIEALLKAIEEDHENEQGRRLL